MWVIESPTGRVRTDRLEFAKRNAAALTFPAVLTGRIPRYDKTATSFLGGLHLAAAFEWLSNGR